MSATISMPGGCMSINEWSASQCDADADAQIRFAGSGDSGVTDLEFTPVPRWPPTLGEEVAALKQRLANLEAMLHRGCTDDYGTQVATPHGGTIAESAYWQDRRSREGAAEHAELEELRAFKAAVPWEALRNIEEGDMDSIDWNVFVAWMCANNESYVQK